jgi:D-inositol-3-phosphate glycosyltransferase
MACGTPIVASRVGGLQFTVRDEQSGLLVPHSNPVALAAALERVITDEKLCRTLCAGARRAAIRYSWQMISASMVDVYQQLVAAESPAPIQVAR